jgi:hypothetical protein
MPYAISGSLITSRAYAAFVPEIPRTIAAIKGLLVITHLFLPANPRMATMQMTGSSFQWADRAPRGMQVNRCGIAIQTKLL